MYIIWFGHAALRQELTGSLGCDVKVDESEQGPLSPVSRTFMSGRRRRDEQRDTVVVQWEVA